MSRALGAAARVLAGVGIGVGAVAGATVFKLNGRYRPALQYGFSPFEVGAPSEDVTFTADDGVRLAGWWLEASDAETVVICCHGHRGTKADMLGIGSGLWRAGHSVLLFDFRGNGDSGDGPQSLSHFEQRDVRAAVDLVRGRCPEARIAVVGFSMGAAATILAAAEDHRIEAVVADSAFAMMSDVVAAAYAKYRLPGAVVPAANLLNRAVRGYSFDEVRPVDRIAAIAPRPMLLLHGTADQVIPYEHMVLLAEAAGPGATESVTFDGAEHCGGYFADRPGYIALVNDFLDRAFA
ncbi:MAG: alpha/beta hydrolase [Propioniciclava sp.]|uniref:alpha/beta hydrolase n=1 Tax=Propioniciclava sp. TaxID=2038686 RepID=UPI0039E5E2D7